MGHRWALVGRGSSERSFLGQTLRHQHPMQRYGREWNTCFAKQHVLTQPYADASAAAAAARVYSKQAQMAADAAEELARA